MGNDQETLQECMDRYGLFVRSEFVPFSRSRNAKPDAKPSERSLNWRVTLVQRYNNSADDARYRDIVTADYSAGIAHCPGYRQGMKMTMDNAAIIEKETETGRKCKMYNGRLFHNASSGPVIEPKAADVVHSLALDADVLNHADFESWASEFGYDADSQSAEKIYRACLEIALKMQAGLGASVLLDLQTASQDY